MLKIKEIRSKSIITKSGLPGADFVINPYVGCSHGCKYCYACFMKKFTGHESEDWGSFVDVKVNASELISFNLSKYNDKILVIGSVTDPYQSIEKKFCITKSILSKLVEADAEIQILTKSNLITRDIELLKKFKKLKISISLTSLDNGVVSNFEKKSILPIDRIETIKGLNKNGIYTILFISPILPYLSNWREIVEKTREFVNEYWFENLNLYPSIKKEIFEVVGINYLEILEKFKKVYEKNSDYWVLEESRIRKYCEKNNLKYKTYFHHKRGSF